MLIDRRLFPSFLFSDLSDYIFIIISLLFVKLLKWVYDNYKEI